MAEAEVYCTHKQLKRVYPNIDSFDIKTPIYGWVKGLHDFHDSSLDAYYAVNTGLITNLYKDGAELRQVTFPTSKTTEVETEMTVSSTNLLVDSGSSFGQDDIIKVNDEYMEINAVSTNTLSMADATERRGLFGTAVGKHAVNGDVYIVVDASVDLPDADAASDAPVWFYDSDLDLCVLMGDDLRDTNNPIKSLYESGENFKDMIIQLLKDASRYLDSRLDPNLPREQLKDKAGNFDYMIIRSTALIAASFLVRATDPTNEVATALMEEAQSNMDALNTGNAALTWQTTRDASRGIIRDVLYTDGSVRPVDTRGTWNGTFDLIKVKIGTGGIFGTATYNVYVKDGDSLKQTQVVTEKIINGDYQPLAGGLQIRFAGLKDASVTTANNEWEIEVMGASERVDNFRSGIQLTRKGYIN